MADWLLPVTALTFALRDSKRAQAGPRTACIATPSRCIENAPAARQLAGGPATPFRTWQVPALLGALQLVEDAFGGAGVSALIGAASSGPSEAVAEIGGRYVTRSNLP